MTIFTVNQLRNSLIYNKVKRGNPCVVSKDYDIERIEKYFNQSEITKDKIELIEKRTGYNLSAYKQMII